MAAATNDRSAPGATTAAAVTSPASTNDNSPAATASAVTGQSRSRRAVSNTRRASPTPTPASRANHTAGDTSPPISRHSPARTAADARTPDNRRTRPDTDDTTAAASTPDTTPASKPSHHAPTNATTSPNDTSPNDRSSVPGSSSRGAAAATAMSDTIANTRSFHKAFRHFHPTPHTGHRPWRGPGHTEPRRAEPGTPPRMRGVLNPLDDYPVHQTPEPLAHVVTSDANAYDRYFFNGYDPDGELFFAVALGVYPNRHIIDASLSVLHEGTQRSVHASGRSSPDRTVTSVGPLRVEVIEPLRVLQVTVDAPEHGMVADLRFTATTPAVEEPRYQWRGGTDTIMDLTRLTQFGRWNGSLTVDEVTHRLDPRRHVGTRDRSWGVRPVGDQARGADPQSLPQFFWVWAPITLDGGGAVHLDVNEHGDGRRWHQAAFLVPALPDVEAPTTTDLFDPDAPVPLPGLAFDLTFAPGTRRATRAAFDLTGVRGEQHHLDLDPGPTFLMKGLGYAGADWGHGQWKGELAVGSSSWQVGDLDPTDLGNLHTQQLCTARLTGPDGERRGVGVLELFAVNDHEPTGLAGLSDGWQPGGGRSR